MQNAGGRKAHPFFVNAAEITGIPVSNLVGSLRHGVVTGTQKFSGYSDTIIDEVIDRADVFILIKEIADMSSFLIDLLGQCVQRQRLCIVLCDEIQQDAHDLAFIVSFLWLKICKNLGEELFCQLFLLVLAADVSVRVELQDLL